MFLTVWRPHAVAAKPQRLHPSIFCSSQITVLAATGLPMTSLAALFRRYDGCSSLFNMPLTNLSHWSLALLIYALAFEKSVGLMFCQQVWPSVAILLACHCCCVWEFCSYVTSGGHLSETKCSWRHQSIIPPAACQKL